MKQNAKVSEATIDAVVLLLTKGSTIESVKAACYEKLNITPRRVDAVISEARKRLANAATFCRDEEYGKSLLRWEELLAISRENGDVDKCIKILKEIDKLRENKAKELQTDEDAVSGAEAISENRLISDHLRACKLAPPDAPLSEHARLLVDDRIKLKTRINELELKVQQQSDKETP